MKPAGYKNHRPGSKAEKAHKLIDAEPKATAKELVPKLVKLGIKPATAAHWVQNFRNVWGKEAKPEATKKKVAAKKTAVAQDKIERSKK